MTPIFIRIWLMKMTSVFARLMLAVSLRSAWLMSRACKPGELIAHLAFDLGFGHERRDRIDDDDVDAAGAHQHVGDFETLLARIRLRDQEIADIDAELAGVDRVERVLGIDVGRGAARLLHLRHDLQRQRRLAGGFRPVDFDHPTARQPADAERDVEPERSRGDDLQVVLHLRLAHFHDRALAELLFDLRQRGGEGLALVVVHGVVEWHAERLRSMAQRGAGGYVGAGWALEAARLTCRRCRSWHRTIVRRNPPNG